MTRGALPRTVVVVLLPLFVARGLTWRDLVSRPLFRQVGPAELRVIPILRTIAGPA